MKNTLQKRILLFAFLILTLTITVNTGVNIEGFRQDYRDGILRRCQSLAGGLKGTIEKVLGLGIPLEEMEGLDSKCQELVGGDPEIVYCLIENSTGAPLYSNDPSLTANVAGEGQFSSALNPTTTILLFPQWGKTYDISQPLFTPNGTLAGRIRIGFPDSVLEERTSSAFHRSVVILGGAYLAVFLLLFLFTKHSLVQPIRRLCSVATEIASGNFKVGVPTMSTREFAELGNALEEMAHSLQDREERLQEGYRELESANLELQRSYELQEEIGAELGRSREMYRSLLEDASDAIVVSDDEDRIVLLNKAAEPFFGLFRKKVQGANYFAFLEQLRVEDIEVHYEVHQKILKGQSLETEVRFLHPTDGRPLIAWAKGSPVVGKDGKRMVQTIYRDVTREREIKENLEKSTRELQRLNQMKDSFLGLASHELKTPLTVIIGYSDLLLGEMESSLDSEVLPLVQHIGEAAARLSNIVRDMVDVSMLDNKVLRLRYREVNINEIIRKAVKEIDFYFSVRRQRLELRLDEEIPPIPCDPDRMVQVITNLVVNAVKFTPDGGVITVETRIRKTRRAPRVIEADSKTEVMDIGPDLHPYVEILIRDTGIGIEEIDQIHIFDKFYEVGNIEEHFTGKVSFKGKGAGLGLSIVKGIVDTHGGEIWVESPGCNPKQCPGSVFHVILPMTQANQRFMVNPAAGIEELILGDDSVAES